MKKIIKVAKSFNQKIKLATDKVYTKFVSLNNKLQALSMDIYDEMDPKFLTSAQEMGKRVLLATDKIYRQGMTLAEMQSLLSDLKSKLSTLMVNPQISKFTKDELLSVKAILDSIIPMDVSAQAPSKAVKNPEPKTPESPGASSSHEKTPKTTPWRGIDPGSYVTSEDDDEWDSETYSK